VLEVKEEVGITVYGLKSAPLFGLAGSPSINITWRIKRYSGPIKERAIFREWQFQRRT